MYEMSSKKRWSLDISLKLSVWGKNGGENILLSPPPPPINDKVERHQRQFEPNYSLKPFFSLERYK